MVFSLIFGFLFAQSQNNISLFYQTGAYKINQKNKYLLTAAVNKLDNTKKYNVIIEASTDYVGKEKNNLLLAEKRATSIITFLKKKDSLFKGYRIINKGEVSHNSSNPKDNLGNPNDRKVIVKFISSSLFSKNLQVGKKIILKDINFKTGKDILLKSSYQTLNELVRFLKKHPNIEIEIAGHVCCNANILKPFNEPLQKLDEKQLSTRRAKFIYRYLIHKKINKNRLSYAGYGFQRPIAYPEKSFEDMKKNKRVEIIITKM